jgi:hypothetical protein
VFLPQLRPVGYMNRKQGYELYVIYIKGNYEKQSGKPLVVYFYVFFKKGERIGEPLKKEVLDFTLIYRQKSAWRAVPGRS